MTKRKEMDPAINLISYERGKSCEKRSLDDRITNENKGDKPKETEVEEQINYQHSLNKFKNSMDCQKEKEVIKEMELNIVKLN